MIKRKKERKIFLDELPRYMVGRYIGKINWEECVGYKVKFIYENINSYVGIKNYSKKGQQLTIEYNNEEFKISTSRFITCQFGNIIGIFSSEFKIEINTRLQDNKRDIIITDRKKIQDKKGQWYKYYKYMCNRCGFNSGKHYSTTDKKYKEELWTEESSLLNQGTGCACCVSTCKIVVEGINDIPTTANWMVKYFVGGYDEAKKYTYRSNQKIKPVCPDCGRVKNKYIIIGDIFRRENIECSCSDKIKYPNKFAYNMLEQLKTNFETEYSPKWIKPKAYDFYIIYNNKDYIIEMDGWFHNNDNKKSGQTAKESKAIDDYKDEQAKLHGIEVIRIDCDYGDDTTIRFEFIKNNILENEELNKLFDLSIIDWNKCNEFALSNLVKIACDIKRDNPDMTTVEIGIVLKRAQCTIIEWLKIGNELGWCSYSAKEELEKTYFKQGSIPFNIKQVNIYKNGEYIGQYPSGKYLEEHSEELFGIKFNANNIYQVCRGDKKSHKGYTFKYV